MKTIVFFLGALALALATAPVQAEQTPMQPTAGNLTATPFSDEMAFISTRMSADDFYVETGSSGEGEAIVLQGVIDGVNNDKVYIHMFFPRTNPSAKQLLASIVAPRGLLAANGWHVVQVEPQPTLSYPWLREHIAFAGEKEDTSGLILVGEEKGRVFRIIIHSPDELRDWLRPRCTVVLTHLELQQAALDSASDHARE
ncbi:MAG: hypothetical protein BWK76_05130 [Desulfobulbaceae bacterium A2]|nr:MAG: hypothetical protein BWK76_05130 [Desulfobulbaceae bacterium A2]